MDSLNGYKILDSEEKTADGHSFTVKVPQCNCLPELQKTRMGIVWFVVYMWVCVCWITGQLDQAATWLLENAESMSGRSRTDSDSSSHSAPPLSGVEVKAESVCICFIDDCLDCDVPLAELTFSREEDCILLYSTCL